MTSAGRGWTRAKLGDVAEEYSRRVDNPSESGLERFVGSNHIGRFELTLSNWGSTSDVTSAMKIFQPGDYLFVRRSLYASDFRERAARTTFEGVCSGDILTIREKKGAVVEGFVSAVLNDPRIWAYVVAHATGSITRRIKWKQLREYEFALPPLEEQRRHVRVLEALQATEESQRQAVKAGDSLLASVGDGFFGRFAGTRASIDSVAHVVTKGESPRWQGFEYQPEGVPFITSENVLEGDLDIHGIKRIPPEFHEKLARSQISPGDVLVNIVGASIGRAAVVPESITEANTNQAVALIRLDGERLRGEFFVRWFLHPRTQQEIAASQVNTARANLTLSYLRNLQVPVPSIREQDAFLREATAISIASQLIERRATQTCHLRLAVLRSLRGDKNVQ